MDQIAPSELLYVYVKGDFYNDSANHRGIMCFGFKYDDVCKEIRYSASLCSPKDNFCKAKARNIISGRFNKGFFATVSSDEKPKYRDAANMIIQNFTSDTNIGKVSMGFKHGNPKWVDGAAFDANMQQLSQDLPDNIKDLIEDVFKNAMDFKPDESGEANEI